MAKRHLVFRKFHVVVQQGFAVCAMGWTRFSLVTIYGWLLDLCYGQIILIWKLDKFVKGVNIFFVLDILQPLSFKKHLIVRSFKNFFRVSLVMQLKLVCHLSVIVVDNSVLPGLLIAEANPLIGDGAVDVEWSHLPLALNDSLKLIVFHYLIARLAKVRRQVRTSVRVVINLCKLFHKSLLFRHPALINLVFHILFY